MPEKEHNTKNNGGEKKDTTNTNASSQQSLTWFKILNSGFVVTLLGGLLVGSLTVYLQNESSLKNQEKIRLQELIDSKHKILTEFSDGIIRSLQTSYGMRKRAIWLKLNQKKGNLDKLRYPDRRNFGQTRDMYESMRREFNKLRHPDSLCAQVLAIYDDPQVQDSVIILDKILDKYMSTYDYNELKKAFEEASNKYQEVIKHMGNSLKKPTNRN